MHTCHEFFGDGKLKVAKILISKSVNLKLDRALCFITNTYFNEKIENEINYHE